MLMIDIRKYIDRFLHLFPHHSDAIWHLPGRAEEVISALSTQLPPDYERRGSVLVHKSATVEEHVVFKGHVIVGPGSFIGAHAYLRGGVFLDERVVIGPGCEVKSSFLFRNSALAHFNFVGDSIIGESVNMEAGSILANHYNERNDKTIRAMINGVAETLPVTKFGSIVGDHSKIGANAVLSPGTVLPQKSVVGRLELVEQVRAQSAG